MKRAAPLLFALSILLVSCPNGTPVRTGSLLLNFSTTEMGARTITPPLDMDVASYNISGSGPDSATFSQTGVTATSVAQNALLVGAWTISVDAFNAGHDLIGTGSSAVAISAGQTSAATVTVAPLSGTGTFAVDIAWTPGLISSPSVVATLTPAGGTAQGLTFAVGTFAVGADSASYSSGNTLSAGYYSLTLQLLDGPTEVWGFFEAVRILKDQTTTASLSLTSADLHTGGIDLTITPAMADPITVSFSGQQSQLPPGTDMTIIATTSEVPDTYQWYLGGVPLPGQTSSSITIGSSLTQGNYRLDLGVTKGNVISSGTASFAVLSDPDAIMQTNVSETGTGLEIYFYKGPQFDAFYTMYVSWVEDTSGAYMHDLFVCNAAATNVYPFSANWIARTQSVPYWDHKACREDPYGYVGNPAHNTVGKYLALPRADAMGGDPIPADLDAVTGATQRMNFELQTKRKLDGISQFKVMLEINQPYDYNGFYPEVSPYKPGGQPSLVYGATIDTTSGQQFYTMSLLGAGEPVGSDGVLHDTSTCTTALNMVDTIIVHVVP
jgi:hypothetical protein